MYTRARTFESHQWYIYIYIEWSTTVARLTHASQYNTTHDEGSMKTSTIGGGEGMGEGLYNPFFKSLIRISNSMSNLTWFHFLHGSAQTKQWRNEACALLRYFVLPLGHNVHTYCHGDRVSFQIPISRYPDPTSKSKSTSTSTPHPHSPWKKGVRSYTI